MNARRNIEHYQCAICGMFVIEPIVPIQNKYDGFCYHVESGEYCFHCRKDQALINKKLERSERIKRWVKPAQDILIAIMKLFGFKNQNDL